MNGWVVVFEDFSHSSRGGYGTKGRIFTFLESIKSPTPDIIAVRQSEVQFIEVDATPKAVSNSLRFYHGHKAELLGGLSVILQEKLTELYCGYGRYGLAKRVPKPRIAIDVDVPEPIFYFLRDDLSIQMRASV